MLMSRKDSLLLIIDVQEKLTPMMETTREVINACTKLIASAKRLKIPFIITEQYPKGLGGTIADIRIESGLKEGGFPEKQEFSCAKNKEILALIKKHKKKQIIIAGIETHICVMQTAQDLKQMGYEVFVVQDGCSSRTAVENIFALQRLMHQNIEVVTFEMALFEWLEKAGSEEFRELSKLVK